MCLFVIILLKHQIKGFTMDVFVKYFVSVSGSIFNPLSEFLIMVYHTLLGFELITYPYILFPL